MIDNHGEKEMNSERWHEKHKNKLFFFICLLGLKPHCLQWKNGLPNKH